MILDEDIRAGDVPSPRDGFDDFETGDVAVGDVEGRELGTEGADAVVPPLLAVSVELSARLGF